MHIVEHKFRILESKKCDEKEMKVRIQHLELEVLHKISKVTGQALNLDQSLEIILGILSADLKMKRGAVMIIDSDTGQFVIRASHGLTTQERIRRGYWLDEGVIRKIFSSDMPFVIPDISNDPIFLNKTGVIDLKKTELSFIGVPITLNHFPIGVLSVDRLFDEDVSLEQDVRFLLILSEVITQLISLNKQVKEREKNLVRTTLFSKENISRKSRGFFSSARSPAMLDAQELVKMVAPTSETVLILGESGTRKILVAETIHALSARSGNPFIKVNCAALPDKLFEAELFGYEKGAFTGATEARIGCLEEAGGGTLFFDEIGKISLPVQAKLLRFIKDKEFERLGNLKTRKVDARIIAATNRDLVATAAAGEFRQDLYNILNVCPIRIPPLRDRREDIVDLLSFFTQSLAKEYGSELRFSPKATRALIRYSWPGNVKEMENLLERLAIISENGLIELDELTPYISYTLGGIPFESKGKLDSLMKMEKRGIVSALQRNNWIQSRAARDLGITLRQMGYRIKKFGLEDYLKENKARMKK